MSLYNMTMGYDPMAPVLLTIMQLHPANVPRFRDCWWNGTHIVLLTRTGGGNRAEYEKENAELRKFPTFVNDVDCSYDSTYTEFRYAMPQEMQWIVPQLTVQTKSMGERFEEMLASIRDPARANEPQVQKIMANVQPLMQRIAEFLNKEQPK